MEKFDSTYSKVCFHVLLFFCLSPGISNAQPTIEFDPVITGLSSPIQLVHAGDGSNRIFIVQKGGTILVYDDNYVNLGTFLTVTGLLTGGEQGLLSLAFHPDYETNGFFFVYYVNAEGNLEIKRFQVSADPNVADDASGVVVLTIPHPGQANHNGGELHFGTDGYLYLSTGDGGGGDDPNNNAQNTAVLLGKILRINVNTSATAPFYTNPANNPYPAGNVPKNEIFAVGLRNPFRWSFDRQTNDMWIGDVGQGAEEEINHKTATTALGANFGWRCYEGDNAHITGGCPPIGQFHFPVHTYATGSEAGRSVVGGVVYRGISNPLMQGYYVGADYFSGDIHIIGPVNDPEMTTTVQTSIYTGLSDFGEAENGEIFAVSLNAGTVYALSPADPLPVELISFTAKPGVESVQLSWKTAMEKNFRQFDVEYSTNVKRFDKIGTVMSQSFSNGGLYNFSHNMMIGNTMYYRLKMVDQDGSFKYSKIISLNRDGDNLSANFVRPSFIDNRMMNVLIEEPFKSLELVGINGSVLLKQDITNKTGNIGVPVGAMATGMYVVRLQGDTKVVNQKVLISQ